MKHYLINMEKQAFSLFQKRNFAQAATVFKAIVADQPDWEHGMGWYNLAGCYEDLGNFPQARECYEHALQYGRGNPVILGGYASFLYLHGDAQDAFDQHLALFRLEKRSFTQERQAGDPKKLESIQRMLLNLGKQIGLSEEEVKEKIAQVQ
jgi:Flp pilus assembly protein TadD